MHLTDPFDLEATLSRLDGDRALFRELIEFYFEDSPAAFDQLQSSLHKENLVAVERAAHSLKGLTANVGSGPASLVAGRIEEQRTGRKIVQAIVAALPELRRELAHLKAALEHFQATPDPPAA